MSNAAAERDRAVELIRNAGPRFPGPLRRGFPTELRLTKAQAEAILEALTAERVMMNPPLTWRHSVRSVDGVLADLALSFDAAAGVERTHGTDAAAEAFDKAATRLRLRMSRPE